MNLVIKGHTTRGKEVIELLEMLGGNNPDNHTANCDYLGFFIGKETRNIYATHLPRFDSEKVIIYTIEELQTSWCTKYFILSIIFCSSKMLFNTIKSA